MRRYRLLLLAAVLVCTGLILRYAAPNMLGLAPASAAKTYITPDTWRQAGARLEPYLVQARFAKIPDRLAILVFKDRKQMEIWGSDRPVFSVAKGKEANAVDDTWRYLRTYPILAASGLSGPKLRDGDRQVPEGIYRMSLLNPNSSYYLAMKLDYPNVFDQQKAQADGRTNLGNAIGIHGWEVNSGSLAIGNVAIEELYLLSSKVGSDNITVIIAPNDLRTERPLQQGGPVVSWLPELYSKIARELQPFRHATFSMNSR